MFSFVHTCSVVESAKKTRTAFLGDFFIVLVVVGVGVVLIGVTHFKSFSFFVP